MRFRTDDRGVTVQIGTVLLFAVLIVLLSTYQATVVPQQNEQVEFNHHQQVQGELQDLRDELLGTAATGSDGSAVVSLSTRYPERAFFVNPPPTAGRLETTSAANFTVDNAVASGEVGDYWTGDPRGFSTRGLTFDPRYNGYQDAPETVYDNSVLYNRFASANVTLAGQRLVDGNRISLVAVNGSYSRTSNAAASVDVRAVSAATRTVTVENETDENVTLVIPTSRHAGEWEELLDGELDPDRTDPDARVQAVENVTGEDAVRLVLEPGRYELELAKVGVGSDVTGERAHYVTDASGDDESVAENSGQSLVVEVRDRYNNPVSDARLNATLASPNRNLTGDTIASQGSESQRGLTNLATDGEGRATIRYDGPTDIDGPNEDVRVNVSIDDVPDGATFSPGARENMSFNLTVVNTDGSGTDGGGGGGGGAYDVNWADATGDGLDCDLELTRCTLNASQGTTANLTASVTENGDPLTGATADYALNNSTFGELSPTAGVTDDGENTTRLDVPERNGTVTAYVASGGDADNLTVDVVVPPTGPGPSPDPRLNWSVTDNTDVSGNEPQYSVSYEISNAWSSYDGVEVEFENLNSTELTETIPSNGTVGTVNYDAGYGEGDTYDITIRALAENGSVLAERSLRDEADSVDPGDDDDLGSPTDPELAGRWITDASDQEDGAVYDASYNVTNRDALGRVEVEFRNLDDDSATRTETLNQSRGRASYEPGYGNGQDYEIIYRVYDNDGLKVDDVTVTDVADGDEPTGNELLANATSPTLTNVDVTDVSEPWNSDFEVDYDVSDPSGTFGSVEVEYKNLDTGETVETNTLQTTSGQDQLDTYQDNGDEFEITVRVYDESGTIVDIERVTETGDGTNDGGGDGGSSGQAIQAVESDGVNSGTQLTFTVENAGSETVTVTDFAVDASGVANNVRINNGDSDELAILRATQVGAANRGGGGSNGRFEADGTSYNLVGDSNNGGSEAVLASDDDDAEIDFRGFTDDLGTLQFASSAANADVTVTLTLADGTQQEFYFQQQ
ncbi:hypothetical protein [Halorussus amylolyticus]|uniref:hypothetical protein n=1 Tax=Halorussus amylolyticus TaxID=1126242 RepID=UPI00104C06B7|nr:hypothetical protein [Halorussus amylolyticus]